MYEVDNRYPEVAEPYEKVRGVRRHGGVGLGSRELIAARRAARINNLKRSFWTSAAAVVSVITLFLVPRGKDSRAVEPGSFRAPAVRIVSAAQSGDRDDELEYVYRIELNDAERAEVTVLARTEDGELLGQAGPFRHERTEDSGTLALPLSRTEALSRVVLELRCVYPRDGAEHEIGDEALVPLRTGPPEPVTEPLTEPVTEPVTEVTDSTEPTETETPEPFTAPTLTITDAALNGTDVTPLTYRYQVELGSAESLRVTAEIVSDTGASLGSDGPWDHEASEASPERGTELAWDERPAAVTLTLTGVYTEDGEEKTLTASQTLAVPEEPFTAPTLTITSAALNGADVTPLTYRYRVALNSAESLRVTAAVTSDTGASLGRGGAWTHDASGTSPTRSTALRWTARPTSVKLTLTGTYTEKGETKTVTATQTLAVPEEPFTAPTLTITSAALNGADVTPLTYRYRVTLNSAESLRVTAAVTSETGVSLGSGGAWTHSASETSPTRSTALRWTARPTSVKLTLTGTYTEKGKTKTITATQTLTVSDLPFTAPTLSIVSAALDETNVTPLRYSYRVTLNSAASMRVSAAITANDGTSLGSGGAWNHTASGTSPTRSTALSWTTRPSSVTLTLTGSYTESGAMKTVTASQTLTVPEEPFTAPTLRIVSAALDETNVTPLRYSYRVTLNSAASMRVSAAITANDGTSLGSGGAWNHTASGTSPTRSTALSWGTRPTSVTLTLTGTYDEKGTTKTVTASQTLAVPEEPFTAPTLRIVSAELNDPDVTPLSYSYQVTLNSAASLQVSAAITAGDGMSLGSGGPWDHTASGTSPTRSTDLAWTTWPASVTLTLTGTYDEKGTTKTVTASQTLPVPEKPFEAPTLAIETARLINYDYLMIYNYTVTLNDASEMKVEAKVTYEEDTALGPETYTIGEDGPYTHDSSLTADLIEVPLDEYPSELDATLTLTGTYTDKDGVEQTITVTQVLDVFYPPFIYIEKAERNDGNPNVIVYTVDITLNSADELNVTISLTDDGGTSYGSVGPFTYDASSTPITDWTITALDSIGADLTLTAVGEYELDGVTRQVIDSREVEDGAPFEAPEIELQTVERGSGATEVLYQFGVTLNSVSSLKVHAEFYDPADALIYETTPVECGSEGSFGPYTVDTGSVSSRIRLVGEYERLGTTYEVYDNRDLPAASFTPPSITDLHVVVENFDSFSDVTVTFWYHLDMGDATSVTITPSTVTSPIGLTVTGDAETYIATDDYDGEVSITLAEPDESVTLTLTAAYKDNYGADQSFTVSGDALASMGPEEISCTGECYVDSDTEIAIFAYLGFTPYSQDPHAANYSFQLVQCSVELYDAGGGWLENFYPTEDAAANLNVDYGYGYYAIDTDFTVAYNPSAAALIISIKMQDTTTGKYYTFTSEMLELS